jgi:hypothetical protein
MIEDKNFKGSNGERRIVAQDGSFSYIINMNTKEIKEFIIFEERNDFNELVDFIANPNMWLVGYNNFNFDNQN